MLFLYDCNLYSIVQLVRTIVTYICILVPIILIVIGTFDLLKAVTASKEDEIKSAQKMLIKRVIYAVLIFLLVPIITLIFNIFSNNYSGETTYEENWATYWRRGGVCADDGTDVYWPSN